VTSLCFLLSLHVCQQFCLLKSLLRRLNDISYVEVAGSHIHSCMSNSFVSLKMDQKTQNSLALLIILLFSILLHYLLKFQMF